MESFLVSSFYFFSRHLKFHADLNDSYDLNILIFDIGSFLFPRLSMQWPLGMISRISA